MNLIKQFLVCVPERPFKLRWQKHKQVLRILLSFLIPRTYLQRGHHPPAHPSGTVECLSDFYDQRTVRAKQESQQISGSTASRSGRSAGVAFSEGGIRSAAFCSGALSRMLLENVLPDYLSCVSGGGYTGAAFVEWKERQKRNGHNSDDSK